MAVIQHRRVYCRNTPCDYEGNVFADGSATVYDRSVATCPKCGFKTLYHIEVRTLERYKEALERGDQNTQIEGLLGLVGGMKW